MRKRITIFHEKPVRISDRSSNVYAIFWLKSNDTLKHIDYWTHQELLKCADLVKTTTPEPMVFASIFRGEWYYRRYVTGKSNQSYGYMVQYLDGQFYFHSYHFAFNFSQLVDGYGPETIGGSLRDPT